MHPLLRAAAERHWGLFTARDARRAGYEHPEIRHLRSSGAWVAVRRGIYITGDDLARVTNSRRHPLDCLAVLLDLHRPSATVSSVSAARAWGLPVRRDLDRTVRLTDPSAGRRGRGFHMTRAPLDEADVAGMGPLRLTSVTRTLVDCAREWVLDDSVVAMDGALLAGRTTPTALRSAIDAAAGWPGVRQAARAVSLADGRAESPLETRGRLRLVGAGLPPTDLQVEIRRCGRLIAVVDAWYEDAGVAVEFDGRVKYTDPWRDRSPAQVLWDEKRREDELRALDIRVVRIADADLAVDRWIRTETRLRSLVAAPGPVVRDFTATPRSKGRRQAG
jgi:hypothetical protein